MRKGNERGITLVALVVTIVVLLILAGITITYVLSENGIINQAKEATEATKLDNVKTAYLDALAATTVEFYAPNSEIDGENDAAKASDAATYFMGLINNSNYGVSNAAGAVFEVSNGTITLTTAGTCEFGGTPCTVTYGADGSISVAKSGS